MADVSERSLALFLDFENLALGFQGRERFEIERVLKRMVEKGKIVAKKAYADWGRYSSYTTALHEAAFELIEIPRRSQSGKNSADIRLVVDAMDLAYSKENIDTFVILSGDSDFSPLVSKLKELGKHVIGLGMQNSTSDLLRDNCDEFIYYEDLQALPSANAAIDPRLPEVKQRGFALLLDALAALRRENKEVLWSSMVKDTMKRLKPSFNETYHGYRSFSSLLEDAAKHGLIELETESRSGTYVVTRFGDEMRSEAAPTGATAVAVSPPREAAGQREMPSPRDAAATRRPRPEVDRGRDRGKANERDRGERGRERGRGRRGGRDRDRREAGPAAAAALPFEEEPFEPAPSFLDEVEFIDEMELEEPAPPPLPPLPPAPARVAEPPPARLVEPEPAPPREEPRVPPPPAAAPAAPARRPFGFGVELPTGDA